jgi:hypothetical protein
VTLPSGGSATFTASATVLPAAAGAIANTATVAAPAGVADPNPANNAATDGDTIVNLPLPALAVLDNFNRANANTLGGNWSQVTIFGQAGIRVNANQASTALLGWAMWNGTGNVFGNRQGAAMTFANTPVNATTPSSLLLKASGGTANTPASYIRVGYASGSVTVATTTDAGVNLTTRATFAATFASGDTLSAIALADGTVYVYKTSGSTTTTLGAVTIPGAGFWTGTGRIGILLPTGARVDNVAGGTVP